MTFVAPHKLGLLTMLSPLRTLRDGAKSWYASQFRVPTSPYTKLDPEFRISLKEHASLSILEKLAIQLEQRYGFRINSVSNLLLVLTVFLTSTFMLYDTITDTMTSVEEKWARLLYIPGLLMVTLGIRHFIYSVRPAKKELEPNAKYVSDEAKQALVAAYGTADLKEIAERNAASGDDVLEHEQRNMTIGRVEEVASRTAHNRELLWFRRVLMDKALVSVMWAVFLTTGATIAYSIIGLFV